MWDDVIVGDEETQKRRGGSARAVDIAEPTPKKFKISENVREFWISNVFLDMGMTVGKNTPLGARLVEELAAGSSGFYIQRLLLKEFVPLVKPERLINVVNSQLERAHENGRQEKAKEIRSVLWSN